MMVKLNLQTWLCKIFRSEHHPIRRGYLPEACFCMCQLVQRGFAERTLSSPCGDLEIKNFNQPGPANFMPVQRCHCKFAAAYEKINGVKKQIVCPIQRTFC